MAPSRAATQQAPTASATGTKTWHALVASTEFWFNDVQNEAVAEQLRERVRFFKEQKRETDFYLVPEPAWLDSRGGKDAKRVGRPAVALVSTDEEWMVFMKVRLDRVLTVDLSGLSKEEVLAGPGKLPAIPTLTSDSKSWTAPYPPYTPGWWEVFFPNA